MNMVHAKGAILCSYRNENNIYNLLWRVLQNVLLSEKAKCEKVFTVCHLLGKKGK